MNPYNSYRSTEERAKCLLANYFEVTANSPLSRDNYAEIGEIVDCILKAVEERSTEYRLKRLEENVSSLKRSLRQAVGYLEKAQDILIGLGSEELDEDLKEKVVSLDGEISDFLSD
jgi:hypothetical protein